jgi:hypothetical protein
MSQVVKAIVETDTGKRAVIEDKFSPLFQDVFNTKSEIFETYNDYHQVVKVYRIGVTLGCQAVVNEIDAIDNPESLPAAIERTKRQVIEAIFGEFRQDFMMVERALYDRDFQKAREYLRVFEDKMYSTK